MQFHLKWINFQQRGRDMRSKHCRYTTNNHMNNKGQLYDCLQSCFWNDERNFKSYNSSNWRFRSMILRYTWTLVVSKSEKNVVPFILDRFVQFPLIVISRVEREWNTMENYIGPISTRELLCSLRNLDETRLHFADRDMSK